MKIAVTKMDNISENDSVYVKKALNFVHFNINSIIPKLTELRNFVQTQNPSALCISESKLDNTISDSEIEIENYFIVRNDRSRHGGGVCIYIHNTLAFNVRHDLNHVKLETVWVEILLPKSKPLLLGTCYRPPSQGDFYCILQEFLSNHENFGICETILMGDFNTDMLTKSSNTLSKGLNYFMQSFAFKQIITKPTRIAKESKSLLDLIIVSDKDKICKSGLIDCVLSDHQPVYCCRKTEKVVYGKHNTATIRSMKNYDKDIFCQYLSNLDWFKVINCDNVNDAWYNFKCLFLGAVNVNAPQKTVRLKQRSQPWFDGELLHHTQLRDQAFSVFKKSRSEDDYKTYCSLRNNTQRLIKKAKQNYFQSKIEEDKTNSKKLWSTLKDLGTSKKLKTSAGNIGLNISGVLDFDGSNVANRFNEFFTNIAEELVKKLPTGQGKFNIYHTENHYKLQGISKNQFNFTVGSEETVLKYLLKTNPKKATEKLYMTK